MDANLRLVVSIAKKLSAAAFSSTSSKPGPHPPPWRSSISRLQHTTTWWIRHHPRHADQARTIQPVLWWRPSTRWSASPGARPAPRTGAPTRRSPGRWRSSPKWRRSAHRPRLPGDSHRRGGGQPARLHRGPGRPSPEESAAGTSTSRSRRCWTLSPSASEVLYRFGLEDGKSYTLEDGEEVGVTQGADRQIRPRPRLRTPSRSKNSGLPGLTGRTTPSWPGTFRPALFVRAPGSAAPDHCGGRPARRNGRAFLCRFFQIQNIAPLHTENDR